ncbi:MULTISPECIES: hypothetical protein [Acinetobacter]|uniref:Big-1 domain-containing protein n=1 Tax=Acinetobacter junii TaxID=40215 RepID=A0A365PFW3_ACIJU|nr:MULTISPECIES: hypothetical protein [Acinetobacter]RBA36256.1 hypothetical protein DDF86_08375 [Acinetobacter junii]RBA37827.1 hypothetical protein DDG62_15410 [Acinetobacter junii]RBA42747.1 hypothetical protein DC346_15490 [Acinetobacter junii]WLF73995.1 hypothetical protein Q4617_02895 [Acinetobacter junii]
MNKKQLTLKLSAITISVLLASCGGGGGYYGSNDSGNTSGSGENGQTPVTAVNITNITLSDTNNTLTNSITAAGVTAKVKVTDASGKGISGAIVTFSGEGVVWGTTNGAVLTNADGEATISVKPEDLNATGAYQISATVNYNGKSASTQPSSFTLQAANIVLVGMAPAVTSLESGASTNITLKTQDANTKVNQNNVTVNFSATCGTFEPAMVISSNQGDVATSYKSIGSDGKLCEGTQTITASGSNIPESKVTVNIAEIKADSLVYTSDAVNLGINSSGSAASGQIEFTLYANGTPAANKDVQIELLRAPNDLSFFALGNRAAKTVKSDPSGKVIVTLYPGNIPGPVEIKATLVSNANVSALSKNVAVSTGRVTQAGLSLSVSKNSLQNQIDGDTATIIARMVDRTRNAVPDGTVISFVSEGGNVEPNCSTVKGMCSVTLTTQNPRPLDNRVTVLAYVEGDKSYTDLNGDNVYTIGVDKLESNIGDFFRDDNEDNTYNSNVGEFLYKRSAGILDCAVSSIGQPNIAKTCDNSLDAIVRQQLLFAFAENTPTFTNVSATGGLLSFNMYGNSLQSVPMPTGSTVSVTVEDNTKDNNLSCSASLASGSSPVADRYDLMTPTTFKNSTQAYYGYRLKDCAEGDVFKVSVAAPDKKVSTIYVSYK